MYLCRSILYAIRFTITWVILKTLQRALQAAEAELKITGRILTLRDYLENF